VDDDDTISLNAIPMSDGYIWLWLWMWIWINRIEKTRMNKRIRVNETTHHNSGSLSNQSSTTVRSCTIVGDIAFSTFGRLNVMRRTCGASEGVDTWISSECAGMRRLLLDGGILVMGLLTSFSTGSLPLWREVSQHCSIVLGQVWPTLTDTNSVLLIAMYGLHLFRPSAGSLASSCGVV